jgi:hypothetical protein
MLTNRRSTLMLAPVPVKHPAVIKPAGHAEWRADRMGKSTIYESARLLVARPVALAVVERNMTTWPPDHPTS